MEVGPISKSFLILTIALSLVQSAHQKHPTRLELSPNKHHLILYPSKGFSSSQQQSMEKILFKLDFNSTQILLSQDLQKRHAEDNRMSFYLEKGKGKGNHKKVIFEKVNFVSLEKEKEKIVIEEGGEQDEEYQGVIGMKNRGEFFKALKKGLELEEMKLWVKIYEHVIEIVPQPCSVPIFPPYEVEIETPYSRYYQSIDLLSFNFYPSPSNFLDLLKKTSNPFPISRDIYKSSLNLQFFNEIQSVPLKTLLGSKCLKVTGADSYECNLLPKQNHKKEKVLDAGLLLFEFDPLICTDRNAIELRQEGKLDSSTYYYSHLFLIIVQAVALLLFSHRSKFEKQIRYVLSRRKFS